VNEIDKAAFIAAAKPIWDQIADIAGRELADKVIAAAQE
jgi:hypothetical protein